MHRRHSAFEALLTALAADFAQLRFFISISDIRSAQWQDWRVKPLYTYRLSLGDDDLLGRWSSATRRTFRKHEGAYRVEEQPDAALAIIQHCAESYGRHGRPLPTDPSRVQTLVHTLQAAGYVRLFTATPVSAHTSEGGLAVLHDGLTAHYWIAGSTPGPAMTVLLGHSLGSAMPEFRSSTSWGPTHRLLPSSSDTSALHSRRIFTWKRSPDRNCACSIV